MDSLPPELRTTRGQIAAGFAIFSQATRLVLGSRVLRRLAVTSMLLQIAWIGSLLFLLGPFHKAARAHAQGPVIVSLGVLCFFSAIFLLPWVGPVALAIQGRAAGQTRLLFGGKDEGQAHGFAWWTIEVLSEVKTMYFRLATRGAVPLLAGGLISLAIPNQAPRIVAIIVPQLLWIAVIAVMTLAAVEHRYTGLGKLLRWHWAELLGYVIGTWLFGLLGFAPWFAVLQAVAAQILQIRIWSQKPAPDLARENPPVRYSRIGPRIETQVMARYRKVIDGIAWGAPLPPGMRFAALTVDGEGRAGDPRWVALLPTGENGREDPNGATRFWLMETTRDEPFDSRNLPRYGDKYAGPFAIAQDMGR